MKKPYFLLLLGIFALNLATPLTAQAGVMQWLFGDPMDKKKHYNRVIKQHNPYLEDARHLQIPQWAHEDWYVEDWTSQKDGMTLISGWYAADILRDQKIGHGNLPELVVGPNFYRLSGLDKRRVVTTVDVVYGVTDKSENASFMLTDWNTKQPIGVFDQHGLRLH